MRPICLRGHERAMTRVLFNKEGDLVFTAAKNASPNVWFSQNGERLGTFEGHQGVIWCIDVDYTSSRLVSGSGDSTLKLWDVSCGKELNSLSTVTPVRACGFSYSGNLIFFATDDVMKTPCQVMVLDTRVPGHMTGKDSVMVTRGCSEATKITAAIWGDLEDSIIVGCESGELNMIDSRTGAVIKSAKAHSQQITDLQAHPDGTMFISASKDHTAQLHSTYELDTIKTYNSERPVNSAAISPNRNHILLGGGQEARDVTTTATTLGQFDAKFYHMIYSEPFGTVKGHFGPINSVCFRPDGSGFATGGEDGYVRLHVFDDDYADVDQRIFNVPP
nr:unnamed protein product [Spirometra erinaceieuropaei]